MAWHPLQENEAIFKKLYFSKNLDRIFEKFRCCLALLLYWRRIILHTGEEDLYHLQENKIISEKK